MNMKGISRIIPTYQSLRSITEMAGLAGKDGSRSFPLVKSPKTLLANYNDTESPGESATKYHWKYNQPEYQRKGTCTQLQKHEHHIKEEWGGDGRRPQAVDWNVKTAVVGKPQLVELGV